MQKLWDEYYASGEIDPLVLNYMPLVKIVANKLSANMPAYVDKNDLVSEGVFGLVDAIEKFEPDRGFKFETYAITRVRGAMYDGLRSADWVPRSIRSKAKKVATAIYDLEVKLMRTPTDQELAEFLDWTLEEVRSVHAFAVGPSVSIDEPIDQEEGATFSDIIYSESILPDEELEVNEFRDLVANNISGLNDKESLVFFLYYYEGLTLQEIGVKLEVTESRVCQIHTKALTNLRNAFLGI